MTSRRRFIGLLGASTLMPPLVHAQEAKKLKIRQVIAAWPFFKAAKWTAKDLVSHAVDLGLAGVELLPVEHWPLLKEAGLVCAATKSHTYVRGMNNKGHHPECMEALTKAIEATGAAGFPNVMTFTGMADTSDHPNGSVVDAEQGKKNCIEGYKKMARLAEKHKVAMVLEPLNSRATGEMMGHPGYQGDHIDYCMEIVRAVSSPGLRILFDAYHVQVMDGDLVRRIEENKEFIGHVQIAGNPGRGAIGPDQEINYRAIMQGLLNVGYDGYVGHEWIPRGDALKELKQAVEICDLSL